MKKTVLIWLMCLIYTVSFADLKEREAYCQLCRINFSTTSTQIAAPGQNIAVDGKPLDYRLAPLPECPLCGGIEHSYYDSELKQLASFVWSSSYQQHLKEMCSWYRRARIIEAVGRSPYEIAQSFLQSSWACRDETIINRSLEQSFKYFDIYAKSGAMREEHRVETRIKMGDILRQLGRFSDARSWFKTMHTEPEFRQGWYPGLISYEQSLISRADKSSAAIPTGNSLHLAVANNDLEAFQRQLRSKDAINEINMAGDTPLMAAINTGKTQMALIMIAAGADLSIIDSNANTYPHSAIKNGNYEILKALVKMSAPIDIPNSSGRSALHEAVIRGDFDAFMLLLEASVDWQQTDTSGNNLLHLAASGKEESRLKIMEVVLQTQVDLSQRNYEGKTPLHLATVSASEAIIRSLVNAGAKINTRITDGSNALFFCRPELIPLLLELGADATLTNNLGRNAFLAARLEADKLRIKAFKATGRFGQNPPAISTTTGKATIFSAISDTNLNQISEILSKHPAMANFKSYDLGETPLHHAVATNNDSIVQTLLTKDAKPSAGNDFLRSPLHYAALTGNLSIIQTLIEAGANIYALDARGYTPLHDAAAAGNKNVYDYLISRGASPETRNDDGYSAEDLLHLSQQ